MKTIIKLIPVDRMDLFEMEAYLNKMAAEGYSLKRIKTFGYFEKASSQPITYRLTPFIEPGKAADKQEEKYKRAGWQYICSIERVYNVYDITNANAVENIVEKNGYVKQYEVLKSNLEKTIVCNIIISLMYILMFISDIGINESRILKMIKYDAWIYAIATIIVWQIVLIQNVRKTIKMKDIVNRLPLWQNTSISITKSYGDYLKNHIGFIIEKGILILIFIFMIYGMVGSWEKHLEGEEQDLPTIKLREIEQDENFEILPRTYKNQDYNVFVLCEKTALASKIYEIEEDGEIKVEGSDGYEAWLDTEFFEVRFKRLAPLLLNDLMKDKMRRWEDEDLNYENVTQTGFEEAFYTETGRTKILLARIGKKVIYIRYVGEKDLKAYINQIYDRVNKF